MRIAVFLPNWVGDVVMATPAIHALRRQFPDAHFTAVCKPYVASVLDGSPWFDEWILYGRSMTSMFGAARGLAKQSVNLAILFPNTLRSAIIARLGRCRRRIGYARYGRGWLLTDRLAPTTDSTGRPKPSPVIDDYNRLVIVAGARPERRMRLETTGADKAAADAVWRTTGLDRCLHVVCLNPGAAFGSSKYWSVDSFANVARRFASTGSGVLVLCGPNERDMARRIVHQASSNLVHSLAGAPLSLGLSKECVRRCDLLITTDSGPRHFAAAFDKPVVTLFGPTHIAWTETYHRKAVHLQKTVPCGPCQKRVCPLDHRCMTELKPQEVFAAAADLLARFLDRQEVRNAG